MSLQLSLQCEIESLQLDYYAKQLLLQMKLFEKRRTIMKKNQFGLQIRIRDN